MPTNKSFETTVPFRQFVTTSGGTVSFPLLTVNLIRPSGSRVALPLLFDTGASVTTLRKDMYHLLGAAAWDVGTPVDVATAGGAAPVRQYAYRARLELFGKTVDCPVHLADLPANPLYVGLLGRDGVFDEFGFGFWESTGELHATAAP